MTSINSSFLPLKHLLYSRSSTAPAAPQNQSALLIKVRHDSRFCDKRESVLLFTWGIVIGIYLLSTRSYFLILIGSLSSSAYQILLPRQTTSVRHCHIQDLCKQLPSVICIKMTSQASSRMMASTAIVAMPSAAALPVQSPVSRLEKLPPWALPPQLAIIFADAVHSELRNTIYSMCIVTSVAIIRSPIKQVDRRRRPFSTFWCLLLVNKNIHREASSW